MFNFKVFLGNVSYCWSYMCYNYFGYETQNPEIPEVWKAFGPKFST
jgi:hypothetical protein